MTLGPHFGRSTAIKFVGGTMYVRQFGDDLVAFSRSLDGIRRRALDLKRPFSQFRKVWQRQERQVFDAGGLPEPWPALSPAYAAWKATRFPGKSIMRRSDRLYASLAGDTADTIYEATPRTIRFGTKVPYWDAHQNPQKGRLPTRKTLVLLPASFQELNRLVMRHVIGPNRDSRGRFSGGPILG